MENIQSINIAIVSSSFRPEVVSNLEKYCLAELRKKGLGKNSVRIFKVPGSWEIPLAVKKLAKQKKFSAIIAFGAIVKGKTYHFEQISNEVARALMQISVDHELPVVFEVWSVYNLQDAIDRATRKTENKGTEAALTALKMINIMSKIK